jgi:hypothetical protein
LSKSKIAAIDFRLEHANGPIVREPAYYADKQCSQHVHLVYALGPNVLVSGQLARAEQEREELVVVEALHAVRAGGLEVVRRLDLVHQLQIP